MTHRSSILLAFGMALTAVAPLASQDQHHPASPSDTVPADTGHTGHTGQTEHTEHTGQTEHTGHAGHGGQTEHTEHTHTGHSPENSGMSHTGAAERGGDQHGMWMQPLGGGWQLAGMAQLFPLVTTGAPDDDALPIHDTALYATQPAVMLNLESPSQAVVLRTTLNFEVWTQPGGEYTFGGWGEGFIDKRHPHTLLHEATLSLNAWNAPGGAASLTLGRGFASFGTEDPMSRPVAKFPTNHHLSQILERWLVSGTWVHRSGLSLEGSVFGGSEPEDAYDLSNIESFGDSYSARIAQRFGGTGPSAPWEVSASWAHVEEAHHERKDVTELYNAALRHAGRYGFGQVYALAEASRSRVDEGDGYWSLLGEARVQAGPHRPYYRVEVATRPEYERQGLPGTDGFYRYDHDSHAIGTSRWQIHSVGYEVDLRGARTIARPFIEAQYHRVRQDDGDFSPAESFGADSFWSLSTGFKLFLGGDAMRMGSYGVLDPMTSSMRDAHAR